MNRMVRGAVAAMVVGVLTAATALAQEEILVEPLNVTHFDIFGAGGDNILTISSVPIPANQCGGVGTDPIPCYEFSILYATYLPGGTRVLHVPHPNPFNPLDAPIVGTLEVEVIPLQLAPDILGGANSTWDGVSTYNNQYIANPDATTGAPHTVAKVRMPASAIVAPALCLVIGRHRDGVNESIGFFNILKRIFISSSLMGDVSDALPIIPVIFQP